MIEKGKEILRNMGFVIVIFAVAFLAAEITFPKAVCYAQQRVKPEVVLPDHYPDGFDGYGRIDMIGKGKVVIDDRSWRLASDVEYYTPRSPNPSVIPFEEGALAGFLLDGEKRIMSLWLIEK
ncbi:MAG: hypothetical protein JRJ31_21335 [Deltaproteobacteria bacterium]|nr:hypothetical protein [Deltaproteobacteria bacterium]